MGREFPHFREDEQWCEVENGVPKTTFKVEEKIRVTNMGVSSGCRVDVSDHLAGDSGIGQTIDFYFPARATCSPAGNHIFESC